MISPVKIWRRQKHIRDLLGKKGKVITWTKIIVAGTPFKKYAPFFVVLVELENGKKIYGQMVDNIDFELKIGAKVVSILRKVRQTTPDGVIAYGVKFKPQIS